ncbi:Smr/MutS family protein [Alphaproteobacteria bacterium]|nr:Smr/MutS family protein [Alphaproteobacteria bacterium]MDB9824591.1 Smr/MutS family protein [Alphaproteobacteria bacterium]
MSHKIKISFNEKKTLITKDKDNQINKISINLGVSPEKDKSSGNYESLLKNQERYDKKLKPNSISQKSLNVSSDKELYKSFKKNNFFKLDLHGQTLDGAKKVIVKYFESNIQIKRQLHIVITGLGNKSNQENFFSGKIRNAFTQWINEEPMNGLVHSYHPCKIQHGGLGAFYIKLRSIK